MTGTLRLGVNIDHVATLRNARGGTVPDPLRAAHLAVAAGADGITAHLREDRRHIRDDDMRRLKAELAVPLNFEMAATDEMVALAVATRPHAACIVPEKRSERTTEGGLDVIGGHDHLRSAAAELARVGVRVSLFIEPAASAVQAARSIGAPVVELHTGAWCDSLAHGEAETGRARVRPYQDGRARGGGARHRVSRRPRSRLCHRSDDRGTAADRRTEHRPFPRRRGGVRRLARSDRDHAGGDGGRARRRMIVGIGTDLCNIERVERSLERFGDRFVHRCFTEHERRRAEGRAGRAATYAKRFAAKEACAKALGTGIQNGVAWRDMGVVNLPSGKPTMVLTGGAASALSRLLPRGHEAAIHLAITDEYPMAQAFVVIEAVPSRNPTSS